MSMERKGSCRQRSPPDLRRLLFSLARRARRARRAETAGRAGARASRRRLARPARRRGPARLLDRREISLHVGGVPASRSYVGGRLSRLVARLAPVVAEDEGGFPRLVGAQHGPALRLQRDLVVVCHASAVEEHVPLVRLPDGEARALRIPFDEVGPGARLVRNGRLPGRDKRRRRIHEAGRGRLTSRRARARA